MSDAGQRAADAAQQRAERAAGALYTRDRASQALGMRLAAVRPGWVRVTMRVRVFALGDSAFAFACNSHNESTVAAAATIDFLAGAREGDELTAEASELWRTRRNGLYEISICNQRGERIALFRGRSYRIDGQVMSEE
jgi:acyl-CoA thioesterase